MLRPCRLLHAAACGLCLLALLAANPRRTLAQTASEEERRAEAKRRGETPESQQMYARGRAHQSQGHDLEAAEIYRALLQLSPHMIEALNDLSYLQATSDDPRVRNPEEAVDNAEHLLVMALQRWVRRRQYRPPQNVTQPFANLPLAASFYKVTIMNTLAAAYAAAGRYHAPRSGGTPSLISSVMQEDCKADATSMATMAWENAQSLSDRYHTQETERLLKAMDESLRKIQDGKLISGPQVRFGGTP
jgi:hypothetical protein